MNSNKDKNFIQKNLRWILSVILIVVGIIMIICLPGCLKKFAYEESSRLEITYYVSQIISAICVGAGAIIAVWEYIETSRMHRQQIRIERVSKAVELAEYYKNNIIGKTTPIRYVYERTGIQDIMSSIKRNDIKLFTEAELKNILAEKQIDELKKIIRSEEFIQAVIEANDIYNLGIKHIQVKSDKDNVVRHIYDPATVLSKFMMDNVTMVLNNLEYFCMNFTNGIADDVIVYQSLHQTFFMIVELLYYSIAKNNIDDCAKYYTNVISIYEKWRKMDKDIRDASSKSVQNSTRNIDKNQY